MSKKPLGFLPSGLPFWGDCQTFTAEWYRRWRAYHLERFPNVDETTRQNLDYLVIWATSGEDT